MALKVRRLHVKISLRVGHVIQEPQLFLLSREAALVEACPHGVPRGRHMAESQL